MLLSLGSVSLGEYQEGRGFKSRPKPLIFYSQEIILLGRCRAVASMGHEGTSAQPVLHLAPCSILTFKSKYSNADMKHVNTRTFNFYLFSLRFYQKFQLVIKKFYQIYSFLLKFY